MQESAEKNNQICLHCATPVKRSGDRFCCIGCEFVYNSINAIGLSGFYRLRPLEDAIAASAVKLASF